MFRLPRRSWRAHDRACAPYAGYGSAGDRCPACYPRIFCMALRRWDVRAYVVQAGTIDPALTKISQHKFRQQAVQATIASYVAVAILDAAISLAECSTSADDCMVNALTPCLSITSMQTLCRVRWGEQAIDRQNFVSKLTSRRGFHRGCRGMGTDHECHGALYAAQSSDESGFCGRGSVVHVRRSSQRRKKANIAGRFTAWTTLQRASQSPPWRDVTTCAQLQPQRLGFAELSHHGVAALTMSLPAVQNG